MAWSERRGTLRFFRILLLVVQSGFAVLIAWYHADMLLALAEPGLYRLQHDDGLLADLAKRLRFILAGIILLVYLVACGFMFFDHRWAWAVCFARPLAVVVYDAVNYLSHFYDIFFGQYQHYSWYMFMGTFIAFTYYNVFNLILLFLFYLNRHHFIRVLQKSARLPRA